MKQDEEFSPESFMDFMTTMYSIYGRKRKYTLNI